MVDEYIPVYTETDEPAFCECVNSRSPSIWALIIEKAWAKLCGSYYDTFRTLPSTISQYFTGAPTKHIDNNEAKRIEKSSENKTMLKSDPVMVEKTWKKLKKLIDNEYLVVATTRQPDELDGVELNGIVLNSTYIINTVFVDYESG